MKNNDIQEAILEARKVYVENLLSIATSPIAPAGQVVSAARLLEKTLKEMKEQEREQEGTDGGEAVLVVNI